MDWEKAERTLVAVEQELQIQMDYFKGGFASKCRERFDHGDRSPQLYEAILRLGGMQKRGAK
jgi:hypothetical protein